MEQEIISRSSETILFYWIKYTCMYLFCCGWHVYEHSAYLVCLKFLLVR